MIKNIPRPIFCIWMLIQLLCGNGLFFLCNVPIQIQWMVIYNKQNREECNLKIECLRKKSNNRIEAKKVNEIRSHSQNYSDSHILYVVKKLIWSYGSKPDFLLLLKSVKEIVIAKNLLARRLDNSLDWIFKSINISIASKPILNYGVVMASSRFHKRERKKFKKIHVFILVLCLTNVSFVSSWSAGSPTLSNTVNSQYNEL